MFRYAQINEDGYVVSDSWLSGEVKADNMIPLEDNFDLSNKRYVEGKWVDYTPEPVIPEPTQLDRIEETVTTNALTTEYLACLQEINEDTL